MLMSNTTLLLLPIAVLFSVFTIGCKDQLPNQDDASSIVLPDSNVSFSKDVERVFAARCVSCHAGTDAPDLTPPSYSALVNYQPQLVVAGEGANSLLIQILDGRTGPSMPPNSKLTDNQINGIKQWINEGAVNN